MVLRFSTSAPGQSKKGVMLIANDGKNRSSYRVSELVNSNLTLWDRKAQRFVGRLKASDVANNEILDELYERATNLVKKYDITDSKDVIKALKGEDVARSKVETLGDFLRGLIYDMQHPTNKRPSANHQNYTKLLRKLEKEGNIINVPIGDIKNCHFKEFGKFLLNLSDSEGRTNYSRMMKVFKQTHSKATKEEKNEHALVYDFQQHAPLIDREKGQSLTLEQYNRFKELDVEAIASPRLRPNVQLYKDFCIFLYEITSRPVDVLRAKGNQVTKENGRQFFKYIPEKKKNSQAYDKFVYAPINDIAMSIIRKYEGQSKEGYIFPFPMNDEVWNFKDGDSWNDWYTKHTKTLGKINKWLKTIQKEIGVKFPLALYSFRRSVLTHKSNEVGTNMENLALQAGTSTDMLHKHYISNVV